MENQNPTNMPPVSTEKQQSWGALIAVFVILAMIVAGAFYAWGKRVSHEYTTNNTSTTTVPVR